MTQEESWKTDYHRQQMALAEELRTEAKRLFASGYSVPQIAQRLNRTPQTVRHYFWPPTPKLVGNYSTQAFTREEKALLMARVYPDRERRAWILRKMGVSQ